MDAVWLCENGDMVRSFKCGSGMVHMHFVKLTLKNRIGEGQNLRQEEYQLGGYDVTVVVFVVNKNYPTNPTGNYQAAEWHSTSW